MNSIYEFFFNVCEDKFMFIYRYVCVIIDMIKNNNNKKKNHVRTQ